MKSSASPNLTHHQDAIDTALRRLMAVTDLLMQVRSDDLLPETVAAVGGLIEEYLSVIDETNRTIVERLADAR